MIQCIGDIYAQWREEQQRQAALQRHLAHRHRVPPRRQPPPKPPSQPAAAARRCSADPSVSREPAPACPDLAQQLAAFQAALPGSRGEGYLSQRGIPLALAQQHGVGYAAPGTWPHAARDWRGGRVVFPHTMPDGRLVNLYGRAVGTAEQVPKAMRHDHLPGKKGYFNTTALQAGTDPLWVCEGAFDALALLAAGIPRAVAIYGVQGWCWPWARDVGALVFALDADAAGQQQWQALARQAALRGKQVAVLPEAAYGRCKDVSEAWAAGVLCLEGAPAEGADTWRRQETWTARVAIMGVDSGRAPAEQQETRCSSLEGTPSCGGGYGTCGARRQMTPSSTAM